MDGIGWGKLCVFLDDKMSEVSPRFFTHDFYPSIIHRILKKHPRIFLTLYYFLTLSPYPHTLTTTN